MSELVCRRRKPPVHNLLAFDDSFYLDDDCLTTSIRATTVVYHVPYCSHDASKFCPSKMSIMSTTVRQNSYSNETSSVSISSLPCPWLCRWRWQQRHELFAAVLDRHTSVQLVDEDRGSSWRSSCVSAIRRDQVDAEHFDLWPMSRRWPFWHGRSLPTVNQLPLTTVSTTASSAHLIRVIKWNLGMHRTIANFVTQFRQIKYQRAAYTLPSFVCCHSMHEDQNRWIFLALKMQRQQNVLSVFCYG